MIENNDIITGGGAAVGRDARAGRDLTGRDLNNQVTNIYTGDRVSDVDRGHITLEEIVRAVIGDQRFNDPGLVRRVEIIERRIDQVDAGLRSEISGLRTEIRKEIVELKDLIVFRNTNARRVPYTFWQGIMIAVIISLIAAYATVWLWRLTGAGVVDARVGAALFFIFPG